MKEGLRLSCKDVYQQLNPGQRASSNERRIKTVPSSSVNVSLLVSEPVPMKEGLRQKSSSSTKFLHVVSEPVPMKEGLRPPTRLEY